MIARLIQLPHGLFWAFGLSLLLVVPACWSLLRPADALLVGFDLAALVFLTLTYLSFRSADHAEMRQRAARNDAGRGWLIAVTGFLLAVVLVAVWVEVNSTSGALSTKLLPLLSLAIAWAFGNLVFALHYAHLYYRQSGNTDAKGLRLPDNSAPTYLDFCYFAFTIGMTFQVSDILIESREIRTTALLHGLIAFIFNVGVVALSVNVVAAG
ncbi:DUF1345 domain-containing protein [Frigidibacter sp. ROC022]|uniref:DUF1345 domain-containing protein n=1 Tax=Frigidibacter sp. ROC022 TaxID=2971796 RepID=UPI00215A49D0|nr:DUF1345 domain-containing protein [Frigidibacter sp. ROC022]MCR8722731.1 DUF1345 domain-containing protein [Frigidibacter sp. ROC022]